MPARRSYQTVNVNFAARRALVTIDDKSMPPSYSGGGAFHSCGQPGRVYRTAMPSEQGVPKKYGSNRQGIGIDAIQSLQQWFDRGTSVRGTLRGSVVAV